MYLARKEVGDRRYQYVLRESYLRDGIFYSRDLADLGRNPRDFIVASNEPFFHLDERLITRLREQGATATDEELEELFFPFIDPYVKIRLQTFRDRHVYRHWHPAPEHLRQRALQETHVVDRRRLHFLRLGRTTADGVEKASALYTVLLDKSRDEIEQLIMAQEEKLPPREYQQYVFALFDLQRFFHESFARSIPQALNQGRLDTLLVEEVCRLAGDQTFWRGFPTTDRLPSYLVRYLIMYFDAAETPTAWTRFGRASRSRRFHRARNTDTVRMSRAQAAALFGVSEQQLATLNKKELSRLYRRQAQQLHPDKGGDAEQFIRLTAVYEELLASLP